LIAACARRSDELQREYAQQQLAVPSWFSLSSRSGALEVTLEPHSCFNAEAYASELGLSADAELRVNLGAPHNGPLVARRAPCPD